MSATALDIEVPEAEALVAPFRTRFDPSAAEGMPAHITLLYPFLDRNRIDATVLDQLRECFAAFAPIRYRLAATRRFGSQVLYLAPDPAEPFRRLTQAIWNRFPETPPFGGQHPDIVPHLTIANLVDAAAFEAAAGKFARPAEAGLPIAAFASEVALMENVDGRWRRRAGFQFGPH